MPKNVSILLSLLEYEFKNDKYINIALTHSSYINEHNLKDTVSNERLEFLGDAVLDLIIGEYFYYSHKNLKEGSLSKLRSKVVNENSLYKIATNISIGDFMYFGKGEIKNKGNLRESTLSDCLEALIGAIYIDGGLDAVRKVILRLFHDRIMEVENLKSLEDYKTMLQECIQRNKMGNIKYVIYDEKGPSNDKVFYSNVLINDIIIGNGYGKTKKSSEQLAAKNALIRIGELDV
ncbi:ribonuclease III [Peptoniphilus sp. oral taxon 386]|uniref:ribonuclease III n=1 Tax=Peptoniphilus sp. oral taxon 386 TaxID=652713 RepID=UPI0001DA9BB3|nr:ribonuclease III [Peptoniphilus sp. oral taxon 386]EFI42357.1 ribonuclease III [Peptoniphilus sp. oral taxon 386 str. F0131]